MKIRASRQMTRHIALAGGLVMLFAGCQVSTPTTQNNAQQQGLTRKAPGTAGGTATTDGSQQAAPATNATVTGTVTDTAGKPVAGATVASFYGATTKTDENGKYSLNVVADDRLIVDVSDDSHVPRQMLTAVDEGGAATIDVTLKALDAAHKTIGTTGGELVSSDGNSKIEFPAGALKGDTDVRVTWLDPMASDQFPEAYGQLPGPLLTQGQDTPPLNIPPLGFSRVDLNGAGLAAGAQVTLKMKVDPKALQEAQNLQAGIDFNNPDSLQQPCYEYDRATGLWVNPATSKLEKDSNGDVWFVYTIHGDAQAKNFKVLQAVSQGGFVVGHKTIQVPETRLDHWKVEVGGAVWKTFSTESAVDYFCDHGGSCWSGTKQAVYKTVMVDRIEDIFGFNLTGHVKERSSNPAYNNDAIGGARVPHGSDYFGGTVKYTGGGGNFTVPVAHENSRVWVGAASWRGASGNGGWEQVINTDGRVTANVVGGSLGASISNSNLNSGNWSGSINSVASRDSSIRLNPPAAPLRILGNPTLQGSVPVNGTLNFGTITIVRDFGGRVTEQVTGGDNANQPNKAVNGEGLPGATVTFSPADINGNTTATTGGDGGFGFTLLGNQTPAPTASASFFATGGSGPLANIPVNTDSSVTLTLNGTNSEFNSAEVGQQVTLTYTVDGVSYTKTYTADATGSVTLTFARDKQDNSLQFAVTGIKMADMTSTGQLPSATLRPGDKKSAQASVAFVGGTAK